MRKSRFSEEQIIAVLKEHQAGLPVAEICRRHGIQPVPYGPQPQPILAMIEGNKGGRVKPHRTRCCY